MSHARLLVLQELNHRGELSQADLQQLLSVDGAVITRLVKQMEAEGILGRRPYPADNRFTLVTLTGQGHKRIEEILAKARSMLPLLLEGLSEEEIYCTQKALTLIRQNAENLLASRAAAGQKPADCDS